MQPVKRALEIPETSSLLSTFLHLFSESTFFIRLGHVAFEFVTPSLALKRAVIMNNCTLFWQNTPQFDLGHIIDKGHSISAGSSALSKFNARFQVTQCQAVVPYGIQVCNCRKRLPRFQTNMRVTKSLPMCRNEMKRCRFGVQNGILTWQVYDFRFHELFSLDTSMLKDKYLINTEHSFSSKSV